jgi:purine-binding chemotaxis protein CheW
MALLSRPPGLASFLEGFLNLRGAAVPVLRLDRLFPFPAKPPGLYTPLVVLRGADHPLALLVEHVQQVVSVPEEAFLPVREKSCFNDCTEAQVTLGEDGAVVHVLSVERLLLEQERRYVAEMHAITQQCLGEVEAQ